MENRRAFLKAVAALSLAGPTITAPAEKPVAQTLTTAATSKANDRAFWLDVLEKIATPVLGNLSRGELRKNMPVEATHPETRAPYAHLEAFGRLLAGIAPWLGAQDLDEAEAKRQQKLVSLAQASLEAATNPDSPDFLNFNRGAQPLVDAAFLTQGILRARNVLWDPLNARMQRQVMNALKSSREIRTPKDSNWVMFAAMIETALLMMGEKTIPDRLEGSLRRMFGWYKGDGVYGDGEYFHFDYYNSFVIHPMLVDVLAELRRRDTRFEPVYAEALRRARRYAEIQERLIAPDGTFPSLGRSATYRFGAFHALAQIASMQELPVALKPAQVRCGMTAVMRKMIEAPGTFDNQGWLQIGFCGNQPSLAEAYISTGSLYLCANALPPLGLPAADEFWSAPAAPWTQQQLWAGQALLPDHAIHDQKEVQVPVFRPQKAAH